MSCNISPLDVRNYLEGFCLDQSDVTTFTATFLAGESQITLSGDIASLKANTTLSGPGIATGTIMTEVNTGTGLVTLSIPTLSAETSVTLSVIQYDFITDDWIIKRRDNYVIPWIKKRTGISFGGPAVREEYLSGNGLETLILSTKPVIELLELKYLQVPVEESTDISQSVIADKEQGILISRTRVIDAASRTVFRRGTKNIYVKYTSGYSDLQTEAPDVCEAIISWLAKEVLVLIASRTGGGTSESTPGYNRTYGNRGKYTELINEIDRKVYSILSGYFDPVGGP